MASFPSCTAKSSGKIPQIAVLAVVLVGFAQLALGETKGAKKTEPSLSPAPPPSYTAKTRDRAKRQGLVKAAGTNWSCRNNFCTATAPFPPINAATCQAIRAEVGNIAALGDGKNFLSADELRKCNAVRPQSGTVGTATPGNIKTPSAPPLGGAATALSPALTRQIDRRNEGFRKAEEALAQQRHRAEAEAEAAGPPSGGRDIVSQGDDCDDHNASVHPGATEVCNLIDDNCDGAVDERVLATFYLDADGDLHGNPARSLEACPHQIGTMSEGAYLVPLGNDCDDANPDRWHGC
jgi:hypothetical protein